MNRKITISMLRSVAAVLGITLIAIMPIWGFKASLGVLIGGVWSLGNLWCLVKLLEVGFGPNRSTSRLLIWVLIKFPMLYLVVFALLHLSIVSALNFAVGFTVVLIAWIIWMAIRTPQLLASASSK